MGMKLKIRCQESQTPLEMRFIAAQANLSAGRQRLLKQILDEPQENFYLSSREMGRHYWVDSAAIVRTIQAIDYKKNCCDACRNIYKSFNS